MANTKYWIGVKKNFLLFYWVFELFCTYNHDISIDFLTGIRYWKYYFLSDAPCYQKMVLRDYYFRVRPPVNGFKQFQTLLCSMWFAITWNCRKRSSTVFQWDFQYANDSQLKWSSPFNPKKACVLLNIGLSSAMCWVESMLKSNTDMTVDAAFFSRKFDSWIVIYPVLGGVAFPWKNRSAVWECSLMNFRYHQLPREQLE